MSRWVRITSALVLALVSGVGTGRTEAATPQVVTLAGSRTAWVEITLKAPITFDMEAVHPRSSGRFTGFYVDPVAPVHRGLGGLVPRDLRAPGATESYLVPIWNDSDSAQTLAPGRYRFYLLTDRPVTLRLPLKDGRGMNLRPTHPATATLASKPDILVNALEADNVQSLNVSGARSIALSVIVIGRFHAFAGDIGTCLRKPETQCGSATNGGIDGPFAGAAVNPFAESDFGWTTIYRPGVLPPGHYEAWQGALNAAGGLKWAAGVAFSLALV
jgi:hypothetical protein